MKFTRLSSVAACGIVSFLVALVLAVLPDAAFAQANPFIGTWKLNLAKSTFDPGPPPRSRTVTIEQVGEGVKWAIEEVDAKGNLITVVEMPKFDGKDYPSTVSPTPDAYTVAFKRIDAYTLEETVKKAGKVFATWRQVVSQDGRVRTATRLTGTNASGQPVHDVMVFDRQ